MLSVKEVEAFYQYVPARLLEIVLELRNLIYSVCPDASEIIQWKDLSYFDSRRDGTVSAGICQIFVAKDHVQLAFIHGAFLPHPHSLLEGRAHYKRFVRIYSYEETPWEARKELIRASAGLTPALSKQIKYKRQRDVNWCTLP
jgi:hypothetical protein